MNPIGKHRAAATVSLCMLMLCSSYAHASLAISATVWAYRDFQGTPVYISANSASGSGPLSDSASQLTSTSFASAYVYADYGVLRASAQATGELNNSGVSATGGTVGTRALWSDSIRVTSGNLALGTAVTLTGQMHLQAFISINNTNTVNDASPFYTASSNQVPALILDQLWINGNFYNLVDTGQQGFGRTQERTIVINTFVGDVLSMTADLMTNASALAVGDIMSQNVLLDASHSALFGLTSSDPNVSYESESGHVYSFAAAANNVPEPRTLSLIVIALFTLAHVRQRKTARFNRRHVDNAKGHYGIPPP